MPSILCVGDESLLNRSRAAVLRTTGCAVVETSSAGAERLLKDHAYDLVLLCHTVPAAATAAILEQARSLPLRPRLAQVTAPLGRAAPEADVLAVDPFEGPRMLAEKISRALGVSSGGAAPQSLKKPPLPISAPSALRAGLRMMAAGRR